MATVQCQACGGIYEALLEDGTRYFHACSPLSVPEMTAALAAGTLVLPTREAARYAAAQQLDTSKPVPKDNATRADLVLGSLTIARPNARNENVDPVKVLEAREPDGKLRPGKTADDVMKSVGAGVTLVAAEAIDVI